MLQFLQQTSNRRPCVVFLVWIFWSGSANGFHVSERQPSQPVLFPFVVSCYLEFKLFFYSELKNYILCPIASWVSLVSTTKCIWLVRTPLIFLLDEDSSCLCPKQRTPIQCSLKWNFSSHLCVKECTNAAYQMHVAYNHSKQLCCCHNNKLNLRYVQCLDRNTDLSAERAKSRADISV